MEQDNSFCIQITADGSHTIFIPGLNEHYHSVNGAIQESMHIFIKNGLFQIQKPKIRILEIGFGTGLNALLTLLNATDKKIHYTALELYPLLPEMALELNYPQRLEDKRAPEFFRELHSLPWEKENFVTSFFTLMKRKTDFTSFVFSDTYDLIYFDAFAPEKQSEMWSQLLFDRLFSVTEPNGILSTYCAKGVVRRMLQQSGYLVKRLPGPPGKREILQALKK
ncbi:MAG: tRNA (5-methylaminomethyl-2-thiouridine)(34)-methyltransferase MnmD [Bacteroidales bacterium]|nr:tRNA (5-methylaminomethyl-2-thiouridine)(34)-methyltransferase MnmD [Bacteroidales bacterium]